MDNNCALSAVEHVLRSELNIYMGQFPRKLPHR